LLALFVTGFLPMDPDTSVRAAGTLARPRMLVAATPTTTKQVSAISATAFVKRLFSHLIDNSRSPSRQIGH
jgi:flagellar biosynthesis regulator FlaF